MKILMYSLDKQFFEPDSDIRNRIIEYGKLAKRIDVVIFTRNKFKSKQIAKNVWIYPTNSWHKLFYIYDGIKLGKKIITENNCDLVVTQDPYITGLTGYCLAKKFKIKLLVSAYGNNIFNPYWLSENWWHRIFKIIGQKVFKRADAIQTDGFETVEELTIKYGNKVFWKPMVPSNINQFKNLEKKFDRSVKILFIGRLVKQKNLPMLLNVVELLSMSDIAKNISFTIVGNGPLKNYLLNEIKKRHLSKFMTYIPYVDRNEIVKIYGKHHILILTSLYEGFARVFMEAAVAGLPIVTTRVSGVTNIIKEGESGFVIEQKDANGFVKKLLNLVDDIILLKNFSRKIQTDFTTNYSFQTTLDAQKKIFEYLKV